MIEKVGVDTNMAPTLEYLTVSTEPVDGMSQAAALGELESLRKLEEELSLMLQIEKEQAELEALEEEELLLDMDRVCGNEEDVERVSKTIGEEENIKELVNLKFPQHIAAWAVKESKGDWEIASSCNGKGTGFGCPLCWRNITRVGKRRKQYLRCYNVIVVFRFALFDLFIHSFLVPATGLV